MNNIKNIIKPKKLEKGANIRVISPVRSLKLLSNESIDIATKRLESLGYRVSFGKNVNEIDEFNSSSIESRIQDLHDAFFDKSVDAVLTVIGGYNSNQLLDYIDYDLIANNPKIFCGFSDVTTLCNAITSKTGLITYVGPHYSSWGMKLGYEYSMEYFIKCCCKNDIYELSASSEWSDDPWFINQDDRKFYKNDGLWLINEGVGSGRIVGGHLRCLSSLQGTKYWPLLQDSVLFIEEDSEVSAPIFDRHIQSLIHQRDFMGVKAIVIGRFQKESRMTIDLLNKIIKSKKELDKIPVIANFDLGHTTPMATIPIGGTASLVAKEDGVKVTIIDH